MTRERHLSVPDIALAASDEARLAEMMSRQSITSTDEVQARRSSLVAAQIANQRLFSKLQADHFPVEDVQEQLPNNLKIKMQLQRGSISGPIHRIEKEEAQGVHYLPGENYVTMHQLSSTSSGNLQRHRSSMLMKLFLLLSTLIMSTFVAIYFVVDNFKPSVVRTPLGVIYGKSTSRMGRSVHEFLGVPYAQAPVGSLRFRKPRPLKEFSNPLKAFYKAPACVQYTGGAFNTVDQELPQQSEDCLYLNIWVPGDFLGSKDRNSEAGRLAVMVWIHGGAFIMGTPNKQDGALLAAMGHVIVVSVAYRLALLGFSYSGKNHSHYDENEDLHIPANIGLLDQVEALRWIRQYISCFGGDPERVTLMGESAGGMSTGFHLLSPLSRHLFSKAIMQSGSTISSNMLFGSATGPLKLEMLLQLTHCPYIDRTSPNQTHVQFVSTSFTCLRALPIETLISAQNEIIEKWRDLAYKPEVDNYFFMEHPYDTLNYAEMLNSMKSPRELLLGTNANEGALFLSMGMPRYFPPKKALPKNLSTHMIIEGMKKLVPHQTPTLMQLLTTYLDDNSTMSTNISRPQHLANRLDKLITDILFLCPDRSLIDAYARLPKSRVYYYLFTPKSNLRTHLAPWAAGALHYEEVQFIFGRPLLDPALYRPEEIELSKVIMRYWTNFAKYGEPTPDFDITLDEDWLPCKKGQLYYMDIGLNNRTLVNGFPPNNCSDYFDDFYNFVRYKYSLYTYRENSKTAKQSLY